MPKLSKRGRSKSLVGIGSRIMIARSDVNYFCKVYKIEKPSIGGLKFDYIVIDEVGEIPITERKGR